MRIAYLDVTCGIAGDMFLASLLDAGLDPHALKDLLNCLPIASEFELRHSRVRRGALMGTHLQVEILRSETHHAHDRDHHHEETHVHGRSYTQIAEMVRESSLPEKVKEDALAVFRLIGEVEARLHGETLETIHFHEVGAVDSIVDIVGVCGALHLLKIEKLYSSPVTDGHGILECAHGTMPVPAPATLELLKGVPLLSCNIARELVTPTGAGLLRHFCAGFGPRPGMVVDAVGYGAGTRELAERPNLLRVTIGETLDAAVDRTLQQFHPSDHHHDHDHHDHDHHDHDHHDHDHHDHDHHDHDHHDHAELQ